MWSERNSDVLVVGGGHAAGRLLAELTRGGFDGSVRILGDEPHRSYERPPLSKSFLAGSADLASISIAAGGEPLAQHEFCTGVPVLGINPKARTVELQDGSVLGYGTLVLATGSRPRPLQLAGEAAPNVHRLRSVADAERLRAAAMAGTGRWVLLGGGYIGLEVAATLRALGRDVEVLERAPRILGRAASPAVAEHLSALHAARGVGIRTAADVAALRVVGGLAIGVDLACGDFVAGTEFLVGTGSLPNDGLARAAGLDCADGVEVDALCRTSDPHIFAVGDVTRHRAHPATGGSFRFECWQNAEQQAIVVAAQLMGRAPVADTLPWFWTEQYDQRVDTFGLVPAAGACSVRRAGPGSDDWTLFHVAGGRLVAAEIVNNAKERRLVRKLAALSPAIEPSLLADPATDLRALAA
jgi:3-phenylpropionate/trans-cinnamate dioxygenase ferredoxin reductase subunit